jgi:hypothetical protein
LIYGAQQQEDGMGCISIRSINSNRRSHGA